jgi:hypothetical protein
MATKTPEQKAAEKLKKLRTEATDLKVEFTEETSAEELVDLIKEAKKAAKGSKSSFDVYNPGGAFVRTYSVEQHGEDAEELAKKYAKKIGGEIR